MTKVVINTCFGGFGLSLAGERAYLARKGKEAFFYMEDRDSAARPSDRVLVRVTEAEAKRSFGTYTSTRDFGERVTHDEMWPNGQRAEWYFCDGDVERDDPDLVAVVEGLGNKAAGGFAELSVVEIPDGVQWSIEEYDGLEHVAEAHRTWRS